MSRTASPDAVLERQLELFFQQRVRLLGGQSIKLAPTERGIPDRLVMMPPGRLYLVELKADGGKLSPIQKVWHERMKGIGVTVHVLTGKAQILEWLRREREQAYRNRELELVFPVMDEDL